MTEEIKCKFYSDNVCRKKYKRDCLTCINNEYDSLYRLNYENQCKAEQQLKRLEQENANKLSIVNNFLKENNKLKKENEELKKQIDLDAECIANYMKNATNLKKENEELKKKQITKNGFICDCEQNVKYKHALEEIRGICKRTFAVCDDDCGNANKIADIIEEINKVLESEE